MLRKLADLFRPKEVHSVKESTGEPESCLVGNIKKAKGDNPDWKGTKQFNRGQKIYLLYGKGRRIFVLGRHRQKNSFVTAWISAGHTENWRIQNTSKPQVLEHICYSGFRFKGIDINDVEESLNQRNEWPYR